MKTLILAIVVGAFMTACSAFRPTGYIAFEHCNVAQGLTFAEACYVGYEDTQLGGNKYLISYRANSMTSLKRAIDLGMYRCADLAIQRSFLGVKVDLVKADHVQSTSSDGKGNITTSSHPEVLLNCSLTKSVDSETLIAGDLFRQISIKYNL